MKTQSVRIAMRQDVLDALTKKRPLNQSLTQQVNKMLLTLLEAENQNAKPKQ
ncbi:TPA: hypothetical protein NGT37_000569 [Vibrio parahaemolyticus]|nr:hypothetical protein [Vibrio parahaemolyticus]